MATPSEKTIADPLPVSDSRVPANSRSRTRYAIVADVEYSLLKAGRVVKKGRGKTVNLSSTGLLFESDKALPSDRRVIIAVAWPVSLAPGVGLALHITGRTVRAQDNCTAVRIEKYEFRVRARQAVTGSLSVLGASERERREAHANLL
jgi:hypothetical protein